MQIVNNLNLNLPHNSSPNPHFQEDPHRILKKDIVCLYGYCSRPQDYDEVKDPTQFFFNPLAAIL